MAKALGLLGQSRIVGNLNQLACQANTSILLVDEQTIAKLNEAYDHVRLIRAELIKALWQGGQMIFKGNQHGGDVQLAQHLLNAQDNESATSDRLS